MIFLNKYRIIKVDSGSFISNLIKKDVILGILITLFFTLTPLGFLLTKNSAQYNLFGSDIQFIFSFGLIAYFLMLVSMVIVLISLSGKANAKFIYIPAKISLLLCMAVDFALIFDLLFKGFSVLNNTEINNAISLFLFAYAAFLFVNLIGLGMVLSFLIQNVVRRQIYNIAKFLSVIGIAISVIFPIIYLFVGSVYNSPENYLTMDFANILLCGISPLLFISFWVLTVKAGNEILSIFKEDDKKQKQLAKSMYKDSMASVKNNQLPKSMAASKGIKSRQR